MIIPIITIDGTSGVGKGTLALNLAKEFNFHLLDSGAIYRVLAYATNKNEINLTDVKCLSNLALNMNLTFQFEQNEIQLLLDGQNITKEIRNETIGAIASKLGAIPDIRLNLLEKQRSFAQIPGLVADGRDMGTVVFPDAPVKLFLDASPESRAKRRFIQLQNSGKHASFGLILTEIIERDNRDKNRTVAPLKPANDALIIDTTNLDIDAVYKIAKSHIISKNI